MNLGKNPTQEISAEQACLGSCLIDANAIESTMETLIAKDFYKDEHKIIFNTMLGMLKDSTHVDLITLSSRLNDNKTLEPIGGVTYLTQLVNSVPTTQNIKSYVALIRKASVKRQQYTLLIDVESGKTTIEKAMSKLEELDYEIIPEETFQAILENTLMNTLDGTDFTFGIHSFNKYLGGLDKGELFTIGGYTSQGKSDLAIQMAINMAKREKRVLFLSTEMLAAEVGRRILGNLTSTKVMDLRKGMLSEEERELLEFTTHEIGEQWNMNIKKIYSIEDVHKYVRKYNPEILFLDYIQNLSGDTDYKAATMNIKTLQSLTLQNEIATICVSQLNRNNTEIREPRLSDLRDTGRIEECSNMVAFIYWKERLEQANIQRQGGEPPERPIILISKNRDGTIGRFPVDFYPEYAQIEDMIEATEEEYQQALDYHDKK